MDYWEVDEKRGRPKLGVVIERGPSDLGRIAEATSGQLIGLTQRSKQQQQLQESILGRAQAPAPTVPTSALQAEATMEGAPLARSGLQTPASPPPPPSLLPPAPPTAASSRSSIQRHPPSNPLGPCSTHEAQACQGSSTAPPPTPAASATTHTEARHGSLRHGGSVIPSPRAADPGITGLESSLAWKRAKIHDASVACYAGRGLFGMEKL